MPQSVTSCRSHRLQGERLHRRFLPDDRLCADYKRKARDGRVFVDRNPHGLQTHGGVVVSMCTLLEFACRHRSRDRSQDQSPPRCRTSAMVTYFVATRFAGASQTIYGNVKNRPARRMITAMSAYRCSHLYCGCAKYQLSQAQTTYDVMVMVVWPATTSPAVMMTAAASSARSW